MFAYFRIIPLVVVIFLLGCKTTFYLMPTPVVLKSGVVDAYDDLEEREQTTTIRVFYATNRKALGWKSDRSYTVGLTEKLRLGKALIRFGEQTMPWDILRSQSSTKKRTKDISINLVKAVELGSIEAGEDISTLPESARQFIEALNQELSKMESKDLTVYVHGATANFQETMAQAAQVEHFTGRNHVVLVMAWPTAESILNYRTDVENSAQTVPVFSLFLRFLGKYCHANYINILAYSAGAQIVSPALYELGRQYNKLGNVYQHQQAKLGDIYFAAPDIDLQTFVRQLSAYKPFSLNVTLAVNVNDFVLGMVKRLHGASRAGLPDPSELSPEQTRWIINASRNNSFDIIDVSSAGIPSFGAGSHDFWYTHPWVSSDVLVQLLFHVGPAERGLLPLVEENGGIVWYYPPDFPERIVNAVLRLGNRE
jgi:esterase/lipase superfamily enzyme